MARQSAKKALRDYLQADYDHWRCLARKRAFREDVAGYLNSWEPSYFRQCRKRVFSPSRRVIEKWNRLFKQYFEKWGIYRLPEYEILYELRLSDPESAGWILPDLLERWYQLDKKSEARRDNHEYTTRIFYPAYMTRIRPGPRPEQQYVEFLLDISIPVDQLTALLEKEVRHWIWKQYGERARGKRQNLDFHLKVFDHIHALGNRKKPTFADVARKLGRKPSTIRDAYHSVLLKIDPNGSAQQLANRAPKQPNNPGPPSECSNIQCRNSETADEWCYAHKAYYFPEEVPQRDLLVNDLSAVEYGLIQKVSGRKYRKPTLSSDD